MLNQVSLQTVAHRSSTTKAIVAYLSTLQRNRAQTSLPRVMRAIRAAGGWVSTKDFNAFWKEMEVLGAGYTQSKRKRCAPRFVWHYKVLSLAQAMSALPVSPEPSLPLPDLGVKAMPYLHLTVDTGTPLRVIRLDVPRDVSVDEIERIRAALLGLDHNV